MTQRPTHRTLRRRTAIIPAAVALVLSACMGSPEPQVPSPTVAVEIGIVYREVQGRQLQLDACVPPGSGPHPAAVLVHGGAFEAGDRSAMTGVCRMLADLGFAAFAVDYRLVPATYPAQVEDISAAVAWLRDPAQSEAFGLDGSVSLLGSSAGAIIVLSTAAALAETSSPITAVVALSAAGDLTAEAASAGAPSADLERVVLAYLGCSDIDECAIARAASPVTHAADLPPTMLVHGSDELIPVEQAEKLTEALEAAGIPHEVIIVEGANHGLQLLNERTRTAIADFLVARSSP